jgi:hypothetical protein
VADRQPHELGARRQAELALEPVTVGFDGPRRDRQDLGGLGTRVAEHQEVEDLALARRQAGERVLHGRPSVSPRGRRGIRRSPNVGT